MSRPVQAFCKRGHLRIESNLYEDKHCKKCHAESHANSQRKRLYGISITQYNELFNKQNGCCKICGKHQGILTKRLSVDHDHTNKKIRGLLCSSCNAAIGLLNENPILLANAISYIKGASTL